VEIPRFTDDDEEDDNEDEPEPESPDMFCIGLPDGHDAVGPRPDKGKGRASGERLFPTVYVSPVVTSAPKPHSPARAEPRHPSMSTNRTKQSILFADRKIATQVPVLQAAPPTRRRRRPGCAPGKVEESLPADSLRSPVPQKASILFVDREISTEVPILQSPPAARRFYRAARAQGKVEDTALLTDPVPGSAAAALEAVEANVTPPGDEEEPLAFTLDHRPSGVDIVLMPTPPAWKTKPPPKSANNSSTNNSPTTAQSEQPGRSNLQPPLTSVGERGAASKWPIPEGPPTA
jgi:hypothetical protein